VLNELLAVERGARHAGCNMVPRHQDVKDAGRVPTLLVRLDVNGEVDSVRPVPPGAQPWTLRDAKQNSFPLVQLRSEPPLWELADGDTRRGAVLSEKNVTRRRAALLGLSGEAHFAAQAFRHWPGAALRARLAERRKQLAMLATTDAAVVPLTIDRFLLTCAGGLLQSVLGQLVRGLQAAAEDYWTELAVALLVGRFDKRDGKWKGDGALLFEAAGAQRSILDRKLIEDASEALILAESADTETLLGTCGLTGTHGPLFRDDFPEPNLPGLGETRIFSKNEDIRANDRYGRFAAEAMPVGRNTVRRLDAALRALTAEDLEGVTWRRIAGEALKQTDLLLAFVVGAPDAPAAGALAEDAEDVDLSKEGPEPGPDTGDSVAAFEKRTERLIEAVQAKVGADFRRTPVQLAVLRKVDPANRKVVYAGAPTVADLYAAATAWAAGERNVPPWLMLRQGQTKALSMAPPHIAPLGVILFSKQLFIRGGTKRHEVVGLPAAELLRLFLDPVAEASSPAGGRIRSVLRMVLGRRGALVSGTAHALRRGFARDFHRREALRTVTMLGVLLHKEGRTKENYMADTAFKLGQLLAGADMVHAGYCADVRGGSVPPSLLGNQVFTMAQTAPAKALATLCGRWKPYDGWAKQAARKRDRTDSLVTSRKKDEKQRGWDIRIALRHAREMGPLAHELSASLASCQVDDTFRAELLLGYIAGLPKARTEDAGDGEQSKATGQEE
jgi:hypothetical protein